MVFTRAELSWYSTTWDNLVTLSWHQTLENARALRSTTTVKAPSRSSWCLCVKLWEMNSVPESIITQSCGSWGTLNNLITTESHDKFDHMIYLLIITECLMLSNVMGTWPCNHPDHPLLPISTLTSNNSPTNHPICPPITTSAQPITMLPPQVPGLPPQPHLPSYPTAPIITTLDISQSPRFKYADVMLCWEKTPQ